MLKIVRMLVCYDSAANACTLCTSMLAWIHTPTKGFEQQTTASFWGADVDGDEGLICGTIGRAISLCWITTKVANSGVCSINLLEMIAGGFVALFSFRRRIMSLLEWIYRVQQGFDGQDIIQLPSELVDELFSLVILCPLAVTDLRAAFGEVVYMCDASNWGKAVVSSKVNSNVAKEFRRHGVTKGAWTRLLSPWKAHQRVGGTLDACEELPNEEFFYSSRPLWETAARGLDLQLDWKRHQKRNRHINVGELQAFVKAEEIGGLRNPDARHPIGSDSQVCLLGCYL